MLERLLREWHGDELVVRHDDVTGAWILVAIHSRVLGPAMGGTRLKTYPALVDAAADALRLSRAMTLKNALAGLPFGGGKAVIAVSRMPVDGDRRALFERYGDLVEGLGGAYVTACDVNTTESDMDVVGARTDRVLGRSRAAGGSGSSAPDTAVGVLHAIRAVSAHTFGSDDLAGRTVAIQGVGAVGGNLARQLAAAGAKIVITDVVPARAREVADQSRGRVVAPDELLAEPCDVLSPCGIGGVLNARTIPLLACRGIAGAANNQLETDEDAERLRSRGIVYAPDFAASAGGVIHLAGIEALGWDEATVASHLAGIGATVAGILQISDDEGVSSTEAAERMAIARIEAGLPG